MHKTFSILLLLMAVAFAGYNTVQAQSTIMNTPSTDVVGTGQSYVEFDFLTHPTRFRDGGYRAYGGRAVAGVAKGVEVGANVFFTDAAEPNQPVEFQPNVKWQFYQNEKKGVAASSGVILYAPLNHRAGTDTFALAYGNASKKFSGKYGPRVTGGGYFLVGAGADAGSKRGVTLAYEQPLHPKFSVVGDWFSGKNRFGYVAPGFVYAPTSKTLVGVSYYMGNEGRGNNGLLVYVGYSF